MSDWYCKSELCFFWITNFNRTFRGWFGHFLFRCPSLLFVHYKSVLFFPVLASDHVFPCSLILWPEDGRGRFHQKLINFYQVARRNTSENHFLILIWICSGTWTIFPSKRPTIPICLCSYAVSVFLCVCVCVCVYVHACAHPPCAIVSYRRVCGLSICMYIILWRR